MNEKAKFLANYITFFRETSYTHEIVNIRRAIPAEAGLLHKLALKSKAHWPYPADYLEKCVDALRIEEGDLRDWPAFVAEVENSIVNEPRSRNCSLSLFMG